MPKYAEEMKVLSKDNHVLLKYSSQSLRFPSWKKTERNCSQADWIS